MFTFFETIIVNNIAMPHHTFFYIHDDVIVRDE